MSADGLDPRAEWEAARAPDPDAVDAAVRAFNGWPSDHPMDLMHRRDSRWVGMEQAITAYLAAAAGSDAPGKCPECGVGPGVLHRPRCFFHTGDPADAREPRS